MTVPFAAVFLAAVFLAAVFLAAVFGEIVEVAGQAVALWHTVDPGSEDAARPEDQRCRGLQDLEAVRKIGPVGEIDIEMHHTLTGRRDIAKKAPGRRAPGAEFRGELHQRCPGAERR